MAALVEMLTNELEEARAIARRGGLTPAELELAANEAAAAARAAATERDDIAERSRSAGERLRRSSGRSRSATGIPPAASALAAAGETLALSALEAEPGAERAIAAALAWRASAVLARDPKRGLELLEQARNDGLGSLTVVVDRDSAPATTPPVAGARPLRELAAGDPAALRLLDGIWLVPAERLLDAAHGIVITNEGHGYDAERGELWFAGETAEAVLLEMDARRRALADEADELRGRAEAAAHAAAEAPPLPPPPRRPSPRSRICASGTSIPPCSRAARPSRGASERLAARPSRRRRGWRSRSQPVSRWAPSRRASSGPSSAGSRPRGRGCAGRRRDDRAGAGGRGRRCTARRQHRRPAARRAGVA